jgi:hypothetical protein
MSTIDLTDRHNRLDELVWVLADCSAKHALISIDRPTEPLGEAEAVGVVAEALVRLRRLRLPAAATATATATAGR